MSPRSSCSPLVCLCVTLLTLFATTYTPSEAVALSPVKRVKSHAFLLTPKLPATMSLNERAHRALRQKIVGLLEKRLTTMKVHYAKVELAKPSAIQVKVQSQKSRQELLQVLVGQGNLQVRPLQNQGEILAAVAGKLPKDSRIRDDEHGPYLQSTDFEALDAWTKKFVMSSSSLRLTPDAKHGGWRTWLLGPAVLTNQGIQSLDFEQGKLGEPYIKASLYASSAKPKGVFGFEVDGELLDLLDMRSEKASLHFRCHVKWTTNLKERRACVRLIQARTMHSIPFDLVLIPFPSSSK